MTPNTEEASAPRASADGIISVRYLQLYNRKLLSFFCSWLKRSAYKQSIIEFTYMLLRQNPRGRLQRLPSRILTFPAENHVQDAAVELYLISESCKETHYLGCHFFFFSKNGENP